MSARLVAPSPRPGAPLFAGWLIGPALDAQIRAALPGCAIVLDSSRDLAPSMGYTRGLAPSATGPVMLAGWSAGCQSVRKLLVDGVQANVVITLDGTHADLHPAAWQIDVWRKLADRARRGECLWLATATQQVYVEGLVDNPATPAREVPYRASVHVLEDVLGRKLPPGTEIHEGGLHVWSSPSALFDGAAHMREANRMPELLRTYVAPWISVHHPNIDNTLRRGARGDAVRAWQVALGLAGFRTDVDGAFGPKTEDATKRAQQAAHLPATGIVDDATRDAVATLTRDTQPGPDLPTASHPLTAAERDALFGRFDFVANADGSIRILGSWVRDNIVEVVVPQLIAVEGGPRSGRILMHRKVAEQTRALFAAWEDARLMHLVHTWAGSWVPRMVRGSTSTLSNHAYGTAFDINAAWNGLGRTPAPQGAHGSVVELVPLARQHGFFWGGRFSRPDGMHLEVCAIG